MTIELRNGTIALTRRGWFFCFRYGWRDDPALGFVVKLARHRTFSERHGGYLRSVKIGPLYARTYVRKEIEAGK